MKPKQFCIVCGARVKHRFQDTCDPVCGRAANFGRTRGQQFDLELRREWGTPIPVDRLVSREYAGELEYNRPYMVDVLTDRRND